MFPNAAGPITVMAVGGPRTAPDGTPNPLRLEKSGAQVVQTAHGWYNEAVYRGNTFFGANQAAQALTSIGTTAQTGLILVNPPGSGKNLVLLQVEFALTGAANNNPTIALAVQATASSSLASPTTNNAKNALVGGPTNCVGIVTTSATLQSNPIVAKVIQCCNTTTIPAAVNPPVTYDFGGSLMLTPGTAACIASIATTATGLASITWEEISQ